MTFPGSRSQQVGSQNFNHAAWSRVPPAPWPGTQRGRPGSSDPFLFWGSGLITHPSPAPASSQWY